MSCFAFRLSQTSRMGFKSHHLLAWGGSGTARTRALGDHACYSCCLWIFRRENATRMVHTSTISPAAFNSQRRAARWGGPGACIGCLPWEVFQGCPSWEGLGTLGFILRSAKHPTICTLSCDVHNSVYVASSSDTVFSLWFLCFFSDSCCVQVLPMWLCVYQQKTPKCQIKWAFFSSDSR